MKVLEGGNIPSLQSRNVKELQALENDDTKDNEEDSKAFQPLNFLHKPVVKKNHQAQRRYEKPTLDISLPHVCLLSISPAFKIDNGYLFSIFRSLCTAISEYIRRSQSTFPRPSPSAWRQTIFQIYGTCFSNQMNQSRKNKKKRFCDGIEF